MAADPAPSLAMVTLGGASRPLEQWLTVFDLVFVAVDPATDESMWILPTAERILTKFHDADCRVAWVVTGTAEDARDFLGDRVERTLTFVDPDRALVNGFGLQRLPALVHVAIDGSLAGAAEGWDPAQWRQVVTALAKTMAWIAPVVPAPGDPPPFEGAPALP